MKVKRKGLRLGGGCKKKKEAKMKSRSQVQFSASLNYPRVSKEKYRIFFLERILLDAFGGEIKRRALSFLFVTLPRLILE